MDPIIIHVDMDAFYAAVETRDDPSLQGKALIIGSLPTERGVVATCSYEAREYGIRSGMSIKDAYRQCPNGIFMHPDFDKYRAVSQQLHEIWNTYATASEYIALDEAYLDVTEQAKDLEGAAKTASEEKKPDGYFEIPTPEDFVALMRDRDVRELYTVGPKTAEKLHFYGIRTVEQITQRKEDVIRLFGKQGQWMVRLAAGQDDRKVEPYRPEDAKSISREITFQEDVVVPAVLDDVLFLLALCVENRARRVGLVGEGVVLKITYADMKKISRSRLLEQPSDDAVIIYEEARKLLSQVEDRAVRLIGVGIYNLTEDNYRQMSFEDLLGDPEAERQERRKARFRALEERYHLDFEGHLTEIFRGETLHRTAEYMRKHI